MASEVECFILSLHENRGQEVIEVRGVDRSGQAVLLRISGFRPHFYFGPVTTVDDFRSRLRREIPSASVEKVDRWRLCGHQEKPLDHLFRVEHGLGDAQASVVEAAKRSDRGKDGIPVEEGLPVLRRFLIETDASGGSWLTASNAQKKDPAGIYDCDWSQVRGSAPDILGGAAAVAPMPPMTTLYLRFDFSSGYDDARFWRDDDDERTDDKLNLVACRVHSTEVDDVVMAIGKSSRKTMLTTADGPARLETVTTEINLVRLVQKFIAQVDPDVIVIYDNRTLGLFLERFERLTKAKLVLDRFSSKKNNNGWTNGFAKVQRVTTYSKDWIRSKTEQRMASSNNLETHRLRGCAGRFAVDALRFLLMRNAPKLTRYDFREAVSAVLGEAIPRFLAEARSSLELNDRALLALFECRCLAKMARRTKMIAEIVEMARVVGLDLDTIHWQAASIRTEQLLLKAGRKLHVALPLHNVQPSQIFRKAWADDTTPYLYHPAPWTDLQPHQHKLIQNGLQGHGSQRGLDHGTAGFYVDPVVVLDFASLYPSIFVTHNMCYSTLRLPTTSDDEKDDNPDYHRSPQSVETRFSHEFVDVDTRRGLVPRLLEALMRERKVAKHGVKDALKRGDAAAADNFDARQLSLKLCANATYGYTGSGVSSLEGKPLAESCLRWGNFYCREARRLIEEDPSRRVIYAQTDSVFVLLPGRDYKTAVAEGEQMADLVTNALPGPLKLEYQRVLQPFLLTQVNRYAGAEVVDGRRSLHVKGLGSERGSPLFVRRIIRECLDAALVRESVDLAKKRLVAAVDALVGGRVDVDDLTLGAYLWRVEHDDLERMRTHESSKRSKEDVDALRTSHVTLAVRDLNREPRRRYRLGEFVPEIVAFRPNATSGTQCDNVESPDVVLAENTPVDLRLYLDKKLKPDLTRIFTHLLGGDQSAVKELLAPRRSVSGLLSCDAATDLLGLPPPAEKNPTTPKKKIDMRRHFAATTPRRRDEPTTMEGYLDLVARRNHHERHCVALFAERRRRAARVFGTSPAIDKVADLAAPLANELRILADVDAKLADVHLGPRKRGREATPQTIATPPTVRPRSPVLDEEAPPKTPRRPPPSRGGAASDPIVIDDDSDDDLSPAPSGRPSGDGSWACSTCTYLHTGLDEATFLRCAMCGKERHPPPSS